MADIKLKNRVGTELTYSGITKLIVPNSTSGNNEFIEFPNLNNKKLIILIGDTDTSTGESMTYPQIKIASSSTILTPIFCVPLENTYLRTFKIYDVTEYTDSYFQVRLNSGEGICSKINSSGTLDSDLLYTPEGEEGWSNDFSFGSSEDINTIVVNAYYKASE